MAGYDSFRSIGPNEQVHPDHTTDEIHVTAASAVRAVFARPPHKSLWSHHADAASSSTPAPDWHPGVVIDIQTVYTARTGYV